MSKKLKRCAIFLYYDSEGIVDEYNIVLLNSLKEQVEKILIVCNGILTETGHTKFKTITEDILIRRNEGMDVGGYKGGVSYLGFDTLKEYDEIILMNYTFFGPLYPLSEMFDTMAAKKLDFWGITTHAKVTPDPFGVIEYGFLPKHLQSNFIVVSKSMLNSKEFQEYWLHLPIPKSYLDSITTFEAVFTKKFEDLGFSWEAYIDTEDLEKDTYCPIMYYPKKLIEERRCPIIKRRSFFHDYIDPFTNTCCEAPMQAFEFIKNNLQYDTNLIWENLLRVENMTDINMTLHLNYFLPTKVSYQKIEQERVVIIFYFNHLNTMQWCLQYLKNTPEYAKVCFVCTSKEIEDEIKKSLGNEENSQIQIILDETALDVEHIVLHTCQNIILENEFVGIINASNIEIGIPYSNDMSWLHKNIRNIVPSKSFVDNVISTFKKEERLGLLSPFIPNHGKFFSTVDEEWKYNIPLVKKILEAIGIKLSMKADKMPIAPFGGTCWFRSEILKKFYSQKISVEKLKYCRNLKLNCSALFSVFPFCAQDAGFYSGWLFNQEYAKIDIANLEYMVRETNKAIFDINGAGMLQDMSQIMDGGEALIPITWKRRVKQMLKKTLPKPLFQRGKKIYFDMRGWEYIEEAND